MIVVASKGRGSLDEKAGAWAWIAQTPATFFTTPRDDAGLSRFAQPVVAKLMEPKEGTM